MGVGGKYCLITFILLPRNVPRMVVANQDGPLGTRLTVSLRLSRTPVHNGRAGLRLSKGICSGINRVDENLQHGIVDGKFPSDRGSASVARQRWKRDVLLPEPQQHLPRTSQLGHLGEDQLKSLLHALIRSLLDFACCCPAQTYRKEKL